MSSLALEALDCTHTEDTSNRIPLPRQDTHTLFSALWPKGVSFRQTDHDDQMIATYYTHTHTADYIC